MLWYFMKKIKLNHNKIAIVDDEDFEYLSKFKWRYTINGYASRTKRNIYMARVIMKAKSGEYIDHINMNKLDNRKSNLRITTNQQNNWNKRFYGKYTTKGVSMLKNGKYRAYIVHNYKQIFIGNFQNKIEAMMAYDLKCTELRGKFAITNKILNNY